MRKLLILPFLAFILAACVGGPQGATQLSSSEVRSTFIGKPWRNDRGTFIFRADGTYSYEQPRSAGTASWDGRYEMDSEGVLIGSTTRYKFFRNADGTYQYHHSRSGQYIRAYPG